MSIDWFFCGSETSPSFELSGPPVILFWEGAQSPFYRKKNGHPNVTFFNSKDSLNFSRLLLSLSLGRETSESAGR